MTSTKARTVRLSNELWAAVKEAARLEAKRKGVRPNMTDWLRDAIWAKIEMLDNKVEYESIMEVFSDTKNGD